MTTKILVVDDEQPIADLIEVYLRSPFVLLRWLHG